MAVGEIDLSSVEVFVAVLAGALAQPRCPIVLVDLRGVMFMGACALSALAQFHTLACAQGALLLVVADSHPVLRPLQITGMDRSLTIRPAPYHPPAIDRVAEQGHRHDR